MKLSQLCRHLCFGLLPGAFALGMCAMPGQAAGKIKIVTATSDLAALAQEVGGDRVDVESIAKGYQDPHFVEAKPSYLLKLRRADLLVVVGLQLEIGWLPYPGQWARLSGCIAIRRNPRETHGRGDASAGRRASIREPALLAGSRKWAESGARDRR